MEVLVLLPLAVPSWLGIGAGLLFRRFRNGDYAEHDQMTGWQIGGHVVVWSLVIAAVGSILYAWIAL